MQTQMPLREAIMQLIQNFLVITRLHSRMDPCNLALNAISHAMDRIQQAQEFELVIVHALAQKRDVFIQHIQLMIHRRDPIMQITETIAFTSILTSRLILEFMIIACPRPPATPVVPMLILMNSMFRSPMLVFIPHLPCWSLVVREFRGRFLGALILFLEDILHFFVGEEGFDVVGPLLRVVFVGVLFRVVAVAVGVGDALAFF